VLLYTKYYLKTATPEEALELTKENVHDTVDRFIDFCIEERKLSPKSVRTMFYGIKKWLEANDIDISSLEKGDTAKKQKKIELPKSTITKTFDRAPTREELQKLLTFTNIRGKTVIEIATSSGLRLSTLLSLKWKDIVFEKDYTMINVQVQMGRKSTRDFCTFITPECRNVLLEYKRYLERKGRKVEPENYVIANDKYYDTKLGACSIQMFWERLLRTAGLAEKTNNFHVLHFHVLRKFFKTACTNANCRREYIEYWMGHSGEGLDSVYDRFTPEDHVAQYTKAISNLSITEAPITISKENLQRELIMSLPDAFFEEQARKNNMTVRQLRNILAYTKKKIEEEPEGLKNVMDFTRRKEPKNKDCQRIIEESALEAYIQDGWHVVTVLHSGKILVSNE
jgi:integrase